MKEQHLLPIIDWEPQEEMVKLRVIQWRVILPTQTHGKSDDVHIEEPETVSREEILSRYPAGSSLQYCGDKPY